MEKGRGRIELTASEKELIEKWLWFYRELASGEREPTTIAQENFVSVTRGRRVAETEHERAYAKWMRLEARARREAGDKEIEEVSFDDRVPRAGWFTDEDWEKLRPRRRRCARAR